MKRQGVYLLLLPLALAGCQNVGSSLDDLLEGRKIDYTDESNNGIEVLQYPPDLLSAADSQEGPVSLSEYTVQSIPVINEKDVVQESQDINISYHRADKVRWLSVALPIDDAWARVRSFWSTQLEFPLVREDTKLGVIETDWLELRGRMISPGLLGGYLDKLLNRLRDSGERDKFITRFERNEDGGVDIYVSHRHIIAQFEENSDKDVKFVGYERQESEAQLEVEMLRRLMLYLAGQSVDDADAVATVGESIALAEAAEQTSNYALATTELQINRPWQESWQLVQIGLDRGGFTLQDRDLQEGFIIIQHSGGPDSDKIFGKAETSFFNKLFSEEKPILRDIMLFLKREGENSALVTVEAVEGDDALTVEQQSVILELLHEYLP